MSAASLYGTSLTAAQNQFEAALPSMTEVIHRHFRNWPSRSRDEMIANSFAALWAAWHSLTRRGKDPVRIGITGIAARCCLYTQSGRRIGNTNHGRGCLDVLDRRAQRRLGLKIVSLDDPVARKLGSGFDGWRQWLAADNRVTPAAEAAFRVDFGRWLNLLPARKRQMAELLLQGHETGVVAGMLDVTPAAVSIVRGWLETNWRMYQGEAGQDAPHTSRPVGRPRKADRGVGRQPQQGAAMPVAVRAS